MCAKHAGLRWLLLLIVMSALVTTSMPARAQTDWTGATSTDWFIGSNWNTGSVPTAADSVTIDATVPNPTVVNGGNAQAINLLVGAFTAGQLTIMGGGTVSSASGNVGSQAGSVGTVTVSGAGSSWNNGFGLNVGNEGAGTLTIENGGTVSNTQGLVGFAAGSQGAVTVGGAGSAWTNSNILAVGIFGTGSLAVENGGTVSNTDGFVGFDAGSVGTVTVSGAGSSWINSSGLTVGSEGTGTLTIANGGTVSSTEGLVGNFTGSQGTVTVSGAGSSWINGGNLIVGIRGTGALTVESGGTVSNTGGIVGFAAGSQATVTVSGAGSSWNNSSSLIVGSEGTGTLTLDSGGAVSSTSGLVGNFAGSQGTVTVSGAGSTWTNGGSLIVGGEGTGTLTIVNGGTVSNTDGFVGFAASSQSTVTVSGAGSSWTNGGVLTVGNRGTGTLTIENGGTVSSTGSFVGDLAGSVGTVTVSGAGSSWNNSAGLVFGLGGMGTLTIETGGTVSNTQGTVGGFAGSQGMATVSGAGSSWNNSAGLTVGDQGTGTLTIENGGAVSSNTEGTVGNFAGSLGTVTVSGAGSAWTNSGFFAVGNRGTGTLTIENGGTVSSTDGLVGNVAGSVGTVTVSGAGSAWTNGGVLTVGNRGTGTLTIANGGTVSVGEAVFVADQAGSTGTLNIGAGAGGAAAGPGTLNAATVQFGAGAGTLNFNHTATDYVFAPAIVGNGAVNVFSGTTIFDNNKTYTGATTVNGGALIVNGSIEASSLLTVNPGGLVGGTGMLPSTTIKGGGALSPGNSIGTITVQGNLAFSSGAIYLVEVSPAAADRTNVTGTTTLAGTVQVVAAPGNLAPNTTYTILNAAGGVISAFDGSIGGSLFLVPTLSYDPNNVYLTLALMPFASVGLTPNQIATGAGVETLGFGNPVFDAVLALGTAAEARAAFNSLSGEIHASAKSVMLEDSRFVREAVLDRTRQAQATVGAPAAWTTGQEVRENPVTGTALWMRGFGSWGHINGDGNAAYIGRDIGGFFVGVDTLIAETWRLGFATGYSNSSFNVNQRASSGTSNNYHAALYGGIQWGALGLRGGAAFTWHDIDINRSIVFPGFADRVNAGYGARTLQVFGEAGYGVDLGVVAFEPFAGVAYVNLNANGFGEAGGAAALSAFSSGVDVTYTTLGLRMATTFALTANTVATGRATLGWRHAFGDVTPNSTFAFSSGNLFTIAGVPIARDALVAEAGFDVNLAPNMTLGVSYSGQIGSGVQDNGFRGTFTWRF